MVLADRLFVIDLVAVSVQPAVFSAEGETVNLNNLTETHCTLHDSTAWGQWTLTHEDGHLNIPSDFPA